MGLAVNQVGVGVSHLGFGLRFGLGLEYGLMRRLRLGLWFWLR